MWKIYYSFRDKFIQPFWVLTEVTYDLDKAFIHSYTKSNVQKLFISVYTEKYIV